MATIPEKETDHEVEEWTKPPFLRRVRIRGYKSIAFCDVELEPLTILVGRNAAGKSNFLDALAFIGDCVRVGIPEAVQRRGNMQSLLCRSVESNALGFELETSFTAGANHTEHRALYRLHIPVASVDGLLTHGMPEERLSIKELSTGWKGIMEGLGLPLRGVRALNSLAQQPYIEWAEALRRMRFYNFIPEAMRAPQLPNPGQMLDQKGQNLARVLAGTQQYDNEAYQRIGSYLYAVVPEIERFEVVRYGEYETVHFWLASNGPDKKLHFDASSMSEGTLRALAALTAAFQSVLPWGCPSVVGIEEPESALHPAAMRALVAALDEATLRTQILLTTHSPDLLDAAEIKPENVRVVRMIDGRTEIGKVDEASVSIVRDQLSSLGGLERDRQLEPDPDDLERQAELARQELTSP
jgi:predicted ATPase